MIKRIAIVIAGIVVVVLARGFFYYSGFYSPPPSQVPSYEHIEVPPAPLAEFSENVSDNISRTVLIDLAHDNNFETKELNVLMLRLISRDLTIKFFGVEDDLEVELLGEKEEEEEVEPEEEVLEEEEIDQKEEPLSEEGDTEEVALEKEEEEEEKKEEPPANIFVIISPQEEFSKEEKKTVEEFVNNGGKLLLIADPTRESKINSISLEYGLIFEPDYLYNLKENEINYKNIFITEFKENEITKGLEKIALYVAGSISSADDGIAFVDQDTFSSVIESRKQLSPIALTQEGKVLAVYDLTFMTEPYNGTLDNNQLIANIADWLATPAEEEVEVEAAEKG
ncbi:MAG: hypothetical protein ACE5LA_00760 [Dehalococcoidales bacterium]